MGQVNGLPLLAHLSGVARLQRLETMAKASPKNEGADPKGSGEKQPQH